MTTPQARRRDGTKPFTISHTLAAARTRVWRAWTELDELQQWFGPKGCVIPSADLDLRPGGSFHYCMRTPDGHEMWGKWTFREVKAPERLVLVSCFSDAKGGLSRHPASPTWPMETLSITTFSERGDATVVDLSWTAIDATDEEHATFDAAHAGMNKGWSGTFAQLDAYLAKQ